MAKDAFYFPHDAGARNDLKMVRLRRQHDLAGVGIFWCIIEMLREANDDGYRIRCRRKEDIAYELRFDVAIFDDLIGPADRDSEDDETLLVSDGEWFWSESLCERMRPLDEKRQKLSEAGKKGGRPPKKTKKKGGKNQVKATVKPKKAEEKREEEKREERTITRTKQDEETERRRQYIPPSSGYDRSNLTPLNRKLGDILFTYFPHVGDFQCDEWALRLNSEYGKKLNLEKLFKEIGESDRGNIKKVRAGMEYRHIRSWCRNADGSKEFALDTGNGMTGGIDIFMSKDGRRRFTGLFKQSGKSLRECIDAAGEDGSAPREMIEQWEEDLKEYEEELNGQ